MFLNGIISVSVGGKTLKPGPPGVFFTVVFALAEALPDPLCVHALIPKGNHDVCY